MINEKDRGQLLRMAGNIACGKVRQAEWCQGQETMQQYFKRVAKESANLALLTMEEVDRIIAENKSESI